MEEGRKVTNESMQKNTISVQTQEDRWQEWIRSQQTNAYQNSIAEPKRQVKRENAPPGLTYGVVQQRYFDQGERETTQPLKPFKNDNDSIMTERERDTTQNEKKKGGNTQ